MMKLGPGELTLAAIAKEAGVTAAVLVQRFGSKRDLLLTLAERFAGGAAAMMTASTERHRSPLAALRDYADCMAGMAASPAALARNLAYLQIDLTDPDFRVHLVKGARRRAPVSQADQSAVEPASSRRGQPARLARTIEAVHGWLAAVVGVLSGGERRALGSRRPRGRARAVSAVEDAEDVSATPKKTPRRRGSAPAG